MRYSPLIDGQTGLQRRSLSNDVPFLPFEYEHKNISFFRLDIVRENTGAKLTIIQQ